MRTETFKLLTIADSVATFPDEVCFAYNPNFLEIESSWKSGTLTIDVVKTSGASSITQTIKVSLYNGTAKIYLSRIFELMFIDPRSERCVEVTVSLKFGAIEALSFSTLVIWGNLALGERFGAIGVFNHDSEKRYYERNLIWFKNFPFTVSLFRYSNKVEFFGRYDNGFYDTNPINRDVKCLFFHKIEKLAPSIPTITSGSAQLPFEIVYYATQKRFVAKKDGKYYAQWTGDDSQYIGGHGEYCVGANNEPSEEITYLLSDGSEHFYRYRYMMDDLVYCGVFTDLGFEDIPANRIFPNCKRKATIKYKVSEEGKMFSTFDHTFDYTFFQSGENIALINLEVCNDTAGYYLRWIDRQGNLQYFLFTMGKVSYKNKPGSDTVAVEAPVNGMYFANHNRTRNIDGTITKKCCAVHLRKDIFDYVITIINAPIIDLYLGKDEKSDDIWLPVNVQSSTINYDPQRQLNDLELSFNIPNINSQTL